MTIEQHPSQNAETTLTAADEAKRRLSEVRKRYRLDPQVRPTLNMPDSPKEFAKRQARVALVVPETPFVRVDQLLPDPTHGHGQSRSLTGLTFGNHSFHYLIRIAECVSQLHCEVKADNRGAAREQVQGIPNLLDWREVSYMELASMAFKRKC